jgi:hypothetical protein
MRGYVPGISAPAMPHVFPFELMAGPTRLELATSDVTGRRSNQLNYDPALNQRREIITYKFLLFKIL